jgi:hypothetical protein
MKRKLLYLMAAACLIAGGALSGTLLTAGAATKAKSSTAGSSFKSNEDPAHEKGESAAREKAEDSGQIPPGGRGDGDGDHGGRPDGPFKPNTDPAHEKAESAAREAQEQQWKSQGGSSTAPSTGSSSQQ